MKITKLCLRYIVPFTYEPGKETECERRAWSLCRAEGDTDSGLFDFIRDEFCCEGNDRQAREGTGVFPDARMGVSFQYPKEWLLSENGPEYKLRARTNAWWAEAQEPEYLHFSISDAGMYLTRNRLGFFWYEITPEETEIDPEGLILFQFGFKKLNVPQGRAVSRKENGRYHAFSMGAWIAGELSFLNPEFLPGGGNRFDDAGGSTLCRKVPATALLFTYCAISGDREADEQTLRRERESLSCCLTSGYSRAFEVSGAVSSEMKEPFSNVIWYTTEEGCSYLAWPNETNSSFFNDRIIRRIRGDYFSLYIKAIYQSYSLMLFARQIQNRLPADQTAFLDSAGETEVRELICNISLFLAKSMEATVSHVHHQSEFYLYLTKRLRIQENVQSVTAGLDALEALQKENREREDEEKEKREADWLNGISVILSLFAFFSAFADGFATVDIAVRLLPCLEAQRGLLYGLVTAVILAGTCFAIRSIKRYMDAVRQKKN